VEFLKRQAHSLDLPVDVIYPVEAKPVVIIKWLGTEPELPSIILNSHMDVVPVFRDKWTHDPFAADIDEEGRIFARGTQDMKSVGTGYLGAIRLIGLQSMCYELRNPIWRGNTYLNFYLGTVALVTIKILQGFLRH